MVKVRTVLKCLIVFLQRIWRHNSYHIKFLFKHLLSLIRYVKHHDIHVYEVITSYLHIHVSQYRNKDINSSFDFYQHLYILQSRSITWICNKRQAFKQSQVEKSRALITKSSWKIPRLLTKSSWMFPCFVHTVQLKNPLLCLQGQVEWPLTLFTKSIWIMPCLFTKSSWIISCIVDKDELNYPVFCSHISVE